MAERKAHVERNTSETKIKLSIDLDGNGNGNIHTGIGFFDNMNALRPQEEAKKMEKEIESGKDE